MKEATESAFKRFTADLVRSGTETYRGHPFAGKEFYGAWINGERHLLASTYTDYDGTKKYYLHDVPLTKTTK